MTDTELIVLFANRLDAILAAQSISLPVVQLNQPSSQGRDGAGAVYFTFLFDKRFGWPKQESRYNSVNDNFDHIETQNMISNVQISVLWPQDVTDDTRMTQKDLADLLCMAMSGATTRKQFWMQNVGFLRITDVRNPYFGNDREQFEAMPSFDIQFTHNQVYTEVVPRVVDIEGDVKSV